MGSRRRARDPRPPEDADEDVLPLRDGLRRAPRTRTPARSASRTRARCRSRTARRSSGRSSSASRSAPRSPSRRSSRGRTTSTRTTRRATRSPSTTSRSASAAGSRCRAPSRSRSASCARTSRRTRRRPSTSAAAPGRKIGAERSLIDFNRGGTPLVEIVTQPRHPLGRAGRALPPAPPADDRRARDLRRAHGGGDAALRRQRLRPPGRLGRAAHALGAEEHELVPVHRPRDRGGRPRAGRRCTRAGGEVEQHTYDYEPNTDTLTPHRSKEEADDYRYFPEPDLVPLEPAAELVERLRGELPELPADAIRAGRRRARRRGRVGARHHRPRPDLRRAGRGGVPPREAFNFAMNQPIPAGANLAELAKVAKAAKSLTREALDAAVAASAEAGFTADEYLGQTAVSDTSELEPVDRRRPRRQPRPGRGVPRRQGGPARLLRRPGDEGDRREGEPEGRQRAPA